MEVKRKTLSNIKNKLEKVFPIVNNSSEEAAIVLMECIKELEVIVNKNYLSEKRSTERSKVFANQHKDLCEKIANMIASRELDFFVFMMDLNEENHLSFGSMEKAQLGKAIGALMLMSTTIFNSVMEQVGLSEAKSISEHLKKVRNEK